jgi:hypothetical protein
VHGLLLFVVAAGCRCLLNFCETFSNFYHSL